MRVRITLIYFKGCPNVEEARKNVREFLGESSITDKTWDEVDTLDPLCPSKWRGFASPTVLINGYDVVSGSTTSDGSGACSLAGAPDVKTLREGFLKYGKMPHPEVAHDSEGV